MPTIIRPIQSSEYPLLEDFLYEAIFLPEGVAPLPCEIVLHPDLQTDIANFGTQKGDFAMGEEVDGKIVGMAWSWIIQDFGHIDDQTPSLSVSLYPKY